MRIATTVIGLVLMAVLALQSLAVAAGGSLVSSLSESSADRQAGEELAGGGSIGLLAALLWLVASAFAISKPKVSMWTFGTAGTLCLLGGSTGFSDLYVWAGLSFGLSLMSWAGIKEKQRKLEEQRAAYLADVQAAAQAAVRGHSEVLS